VFGTSIRCGDCGVPNDGTKFIYIACKGAAAAKPTVVYSTDGGVNWASVSIAPAANAEDLVAIDIVGQNLVCVSKTGGTASASCLYVAPINVVTGVPSSTWSKITPSALNSTNTLNDIYVAASSEVYFVADGGYIYKSVDVLSDMGVIDAGVATAQNLLRIHGAGDTIYASGASGAVVKSTNRAQSFAATTSNPGAGSNQALYVLTPFIAWVGNAAGALYYTLDGGETWTQKNFTGLTAVGVQDVYFPTDEVGYVAFTIAGTNARLATTINGGERWVDSAQTTPRLSAVSAGTVFNRIAAPVSRDGATDANTVLIAGLATAPAGVATLGVTNRV
jgi:photosystem II stability/assembly factor-like uncharacterized protein